MLETKQGVGPSMDLIFDPAVIPSLPPPGGQIGHQELMGRGRVIGPSTSSFSAFPTPLDPVINHQHDGSYPKSANRQLSHHRSTSVDRSSSVDRGSNPVDRRSASSNSQIKKPFAGIGAGYTLFPTFPTLRGTTPSRPGIIRQTSSFELEPKSVHGDRSSRKGSHSRTASDSTVIPPPKPKDGLDDRYRFPDEKVNRINVPKRDEPNSLGLNVDKRLPRPPRPIYSSSHHPSTKTSYGTPLSLPALPQTVDRSVSTRVPAGCIKLDIISDPSLPTLVQELLSLTPDSRSPEITLPSPYSGYIHPSSILTPLAIILESLVNERSIPRSTSPNQPLPLLYNSTPIHTTYGNGEIDWNVLSVYISRTSSILDTLLPLISQGDVSRGIEIYVDKQKKVFGEIACMYMDQYSFVRGWWDENGMKGCAKHVGRWGDG